MAITATPTGTRPPPTEPPHRGNSPKALIAIAVLVILAAIVVIGYAVTNRAGNSSPAASRGPQPTTAPASAGSTAAPTTIDPTKAAVLTDYRTAESVLLEDVEAYPANPLDPRLAQHFAGAELQALQTRFTTMRFQGVHGVGTTELHPVVTSVAGSTATVMDCSFDHSRIVNGRTGQTVSGPDTVTVMLKITLVQDGGTWKVSSQLQEGTGCVPTD
ncbi:MAG: hypothetical protein M3N98_03630 [Actinomycetota bacterium]|nr:hypothetical protein [Actinomycetota bacterium]